MVSRVPPEVHARVEAFRKNLIHYRSAGYNEAQTRIEFIDPLFEALGWDVANKRGYADAYKDVLHEGSLRTLDGVKAPDYSFRVGGQRKFFVEAKKPHVQILQDPAPAYQLKRYAWSAQLPVSILTNFEKFVIYETTKKPDPNDKAREGRLLVLKFDELETRWQELEDLVSMRAVLQGDFDKHFAAVTRRRGTTAVDSAFLAEIEEWRELLAKHLAAKNTLTQADLNFVVQQTIDRIIFLRICEDRRLEPAGNLQLILGWKDMHGELKRYFRNADAKYNSGLFYFKSERGRSTPPDDLSLRLTIENAPLQHIIERLYFPTSPYEFSVLPADLLGHVYEQFLGKVITLSPTGSVSIELKPEVRKAGGVFYTPNHIVKFIVNETLRPLLQGKHPGDYRPVRGGVPKERVRVLDPACGSGTFLLEAYQHLLDWYRDEYAAEPNKWNRGAKPRLKQDTRGHWILAPSERRAILLTHIYGVDIDAQAVEVTKLSLLLKVLEGETAEVLLETFDVFKERALPDLDKNIRCGNSLVDRRIYSLMNVEPEVERRLNPMDFADEFPLPGGSGIFDVVLGNPPYVYRNATEADAKLYYTTYYSVAQGNYELYKFFIERSVELLAAGGRLGMIVNGSFLVQQSFSKLREFLLHRVSLKTLAPLGPGAFANATVDTAILVAEKSAPGVKEMCDIVAPRKPEQLSTTVSFAVPKERFEGNEDYVFDYRTSHASGKLLARLFKFPSLESGYEFGVGINTGYIKRELVADVRIDRRYHPMVVGRGLPSWGPVATQGFILYDVAYVQSRGNQGRSLPAEHLLSSEKVLVVRTRNLSMRRRIVAAFDPSSNYNLNRLSNLVARPGHDALSLVGLLNSTLYNWLFLTRFFDYEIKPVYLRHAPLPPLDDRFKKLCIERYAATLELPTASTPPEAQRVSRRIESLDVQIDSAVYDAFGLSEAERTRVAREHEEWASYSSDVEEEDTET